MMKQKGFSLPEITVAMGLVAGVSLVTMKLVETNAKNQNSLTASAEIQKTVAIIKQALNEPDSCRYMLVGQVVGDNGAPVSINLNPANTSLGPGLYQKIPRTGELRVLLKPNTPYKGFRTTSIQLQKPAGNLPDSAELILKFANETNLVRNQQGTLSDGNNANDKGTTIVIPLIAKLTAVNNRITDCGPATSETNEAAREKFCLSLGPMAVWDSVGVPKTCKFKTNQCPTGYVPEVLQSTGQLNCVKLSDQMKASDLFDTSSCTIDGSASYQIIKVGNKLRIQCN